MNKNKRFHKGFEINSTIDDKNQYKYDFNYDHLDSIFAILDQSRHEFKEPCVSHLIIRNQ